MRNMDTMERIGQCRHPGLGKNHDGDSWSILEKDDS